MKKLFLILLPMVLLTIPAWAGVFVICDPYLSTGVQPTHFAIVLDGAASIDISAFKQSDNSVILKYEVTNVSNGNHNMKVKAVLIDPIWGRSESAEVPFDFVKVGISGIPTGIKLRME